MITHRRKISFSLVLFLFSFGFLAIFINSNDIREFNLQQLGIESLVERGNVYLDGTKTPELNVGGDIFHYNEHTYALKQPGIFFIGSIPYFIISRMGILYSRDYILAGGLVTLFTSVLMTSLMIVLVFKISFKITKKRHIRC
jgi:hypothetical protein